MEDSVENSTATETPVEDPGPSYALMKYGVIVFLTISTLGNSLTVLTVLSRKSLRHSTSSLYLVCLAVLDIVTMYMGLALPELLMFYGIDIKIASQGFCKFQTFLIYYTTECEAWVLVNMSFERLIAVVLPHRYRQIYTQKKAAIGLVITALLLLAVNLPWMVGASIQPLSENSTSVYCKVASDQSYFAKSTVDLVLCSLLPFATMLTINIVIIVSIRYQVKKQDNKKVAGVTLMLLTVTFSFFILTAPLVIYFITGFVNDYIFQVFYLMYIANFSVNFFLYCLSGRKFRGEFLALLVTAGLYPQGSSVEPMTVTKANSEL